MAKQIHFFVTTGDLIEAASRIDEAISLKFVRNGLHEGNQLDTFDGLSAIPNLGFNSTGLPAGGGSFLVLRHDEIIPVKQVTMAYGQGTRHRFDMTAHDRWIYFEPGGESIADSAHKLIVGKVGTNLPSKESNELYSTFKRVFTKGFKKHDYGALIASGAGAIADKCEFVC